METRFIFAIDLLVSIMFIVQTYLDFTNHQEELQMLFLRAKIK